MSAIYSGFPGGRLPPGANPYGPAATAAGRALGAAGLVITGYQFGRSVYAVGVSVYETGELTLADVDRLIGAYPRNRVPTPDPADALREVVLLGPGRQQVGERTLREPTGSSGGDADLIPDLRPKVN